MEHLEVIAKATSLLQQRLNQAASFESRLAALTKENEELRRKLECPLAGDQRVTDLLMQSRTAVVALTELVTRLSSQAAEKDSKIAELQEKLAMATRFIEEKTKESEVLVSNMSRLPAMIDSLETSLKKTTDLLAYEKLRNRAKTLMVESLKRPVVPGRFTINGHAYELVPEPESDSESS